MFVDRDASIAICFKPFLFNNCIGRLVISQCEFYILNCILYSSTMSTKPNMDPASIALKFEASGV